MEMYNETVVGKGGSKVAAAEKGAFFALFIFPNCERVRIITRRQCECSEKKNK